MKLQIYLQTLQLFQHCEIFFHGEFIITGIAPPDFAPPISIFFDFDLVLGPKITVFDAEQVAELVYEKSKQPSRGRWMLYLIVDFVVDHRDDWGEINQNYQDG